MSTRKPHFAVILALVTQAVYAQESTMSHLNRAAEETIHAAELQARNLAQDIVSGNILFRAARKAEMLDCAQKKLSAGYLNDAQVEKLVSLLGDACEHDQTGDLERDIETCQTLPAKGGKAKTPSEVEAQVMDVLNKRKGILNRQGSSIVQSLVQPKIRCFGGSMRGDAAFSRGNSSVSGGLQYCMADNGEHWLEAVGTEGQIKGAVIAGGGSIQYSRRRGFKNRLVFPISDAGMKLGDLRITQDVKEVRKGAFGAVVFGLGGEETEGQNGAHDYSYIDMLGAGGALYNDSKGSTGAAKRNETRIGIAPAFRVDRWAPYRIAKCK